MHPFAKYIMYDMHATVEHHTATLGTTLSAVYGEKSKCASLYYGMSMAVVVSVSHICKLRVHVLLDCGIFCTLPLIC